MKNASEEKVVNQGWRDIWTWTAIDADTKLIVSYMLGQRGAETAKAFMQDVASRIKTGIQLTTDGHRVYADAVENAFGGDIDNANLVKIYGASMETESRYSPATCIGCRTGTLAGIPDPKHVSTSFVERQNLSMRMGMRRFTRLTNAFSKKLENHGHAVALYFMHYNFCRVHKTLRVTAAIGGYEIWPLSSPASPSRRQPATNSPSQGCRVDPKMVRLFVPREFIFRLDFRHPRAYYDLRPNSHLWQVFCQIRSSEPRWWESSAPNPGQITWAQFSLNDLLGQRSPLDSRFLRRRSQGFGASTACDPTFDSL